MNHLLTAELFELERAELVRRLRRECHHTTTVRAARRTLRRRTAR